MRISDWSSDVCSSDLRISDDELLADPVVQTEALGLTANPGIPMPSAIFGASRRNSAGLDLSDAATLSSSRMAMESIRADAHSTDERRVGKECGSMCRFRGYTYNYTKTKMKQNNAKNCNR